MVDFDGNRLELSALLKVQIMQNVVVMLEEM